MGSVPSASWALEHGADLWLVEAVAQAEDQLRLVVAAHQQGQARGRRGGVAAIHGGPADMQIPAFSLLRACAGRGASSSGSTSQRRAGNRDFDVLTAPLSWTDPRSARA